MNIYYLSPTPLSKKFTKTLGRLLKALSYKGKSLIAITAFCVLAISLNAQTYVKPTATGSGSGVNWDNAVGASSLETIVEFGGTVYVAEGTYNIVNEFQLDGTDVELIGGYPITSTGTDLSGYAPVAHPTIFDGAGLGIDRMFDHSIGSSTITIKGLVLQNAASTSNGPVFQGRAAATGNEVHWLFEDLKVQNNGVAVGTAAFYLLDIYQSTNSTIVFRNCDFNNNISADGGALKIERVSPSLSPPPTITNTGNLLIEGCSFFENTSDDSHGGAIWFVNSHTWTIRNTTFCDNTAGSIGGGALFVDGCYNMIVDGCDFSNNEALGFFADGGAIRLQTGTIMYISNTNFVGNSTDLGLDAGRGGAIYSTQSSMIMNNCGFYDNQAYDGGAIAADRKFSGAIPNRAIGCVFSNNEALNDDTNQTAGLDGGGAVMIFNNASGLTWEFTNTTFVNNKVPANGWGGAIANREAEVSIDTCTFFSNTRGGITTISGADIKKHNNSTSGFTISNSLMQLASEAAYTNVLGGTNGYVFTTGNTFSNGTDPGIVAPPLIVCGGAVDPGTGGGCNVQSGIWTTTGTTASYDFGGGVIAQVSKTNSNGFVSGNFNPGGAGFWSESLEGDVSLQADYEWGSILTVNFVDASGNPVQVENPVIHLDRVGGVANNDVINSALVTLLDGLSWTKLEGTSDFMTTTTTTARDDGAGLCCAGANTESGNVNPSTAAGSLRISGLVSTIRVQFVQDGPSGGGTDGIELILSPCGIENCVDGIDNDGDGLVDCDDILDCNCCEAQAPTISKN